MSNQNIKKKRSFLLYNLKETVDINTKLDESSKNTFPIEEKETKQTGNVGEQKQSFLDMQVVDKDTINTKQEGNKHILVVVEESIRKSRALLSSRLQMEK